VIDREALRQSWRQWCSPMRYQARTGPAWLDWFWTFVFNSTIAAVLTLLVWAFTPRPDVAYLALANFVVAQCIGFSIHLLFRLGQGLLGPERIAAFSVPGRVLFYAGVPVLGVLIGYAIGLSVLGVDVPRLVLGSPRVLFAVILLSLLMSAFLYRIMANKSRLAQAEAERERERARALAADKQMLDARLRALQAQIEPHFLFNTLANVVSLMDGAPAKARLMLTRLIEMLRVSLAASRAARVELGRELELVRAYLDILAIRMGPRLRYAIEAPPALLAHPVPPLLIQPLVENAIQHGLEPKVEGGSLSVAVRADAGLLRIEVADDGLGFAPTTSTGVGLSNLRERLAASYGPGARLEIEDGGPGTRVRVTLPLEAIGQGARAPSVAAGATPGRAPSGAVGEEATCPPR